MPSDIVAEPSLKADGTVSQTNGDSWEVLSEASAAEAIESSLKHTSAFSGDAAATAASLVNDRVSGETVPGAPTVGTATGGSTQASVAFTAPASDGGRTITGYTVTSTPGNKTGTGTTSPIVVATLTNGTPYTFKVKATNAVGTGPESAASNSVTPA